jgi:hypothetical protein
VTWLLILTVCGPLSIYDCKTQVVSTHDEIEQCTEAQLKHAEMPTDGDWRTIIYECKLKNGMET